MWKESDKKLVVRLGRSPTLVALLLLMHVGAWASIFLVPIPLYAKALVAIAIGISLRYSLSNHALRRGQGTVMAIELQRNDCAVHFAGVAQWTPCSLVGHFVHPWVVVLRLRVEGNRMPVNVVVVRSAAEEATFRHLRVWLKSIGWGSGDFGDRTTEVEVQRKW